jgi:hypothetical protein
LQIPKILVVIQRERADKAETGKMRVGHVVLVQSNLPSRYLDIVVCEGEATLRDKDGCACGWQFHTLHPREEAPFEIEIEPSLYSNSVEDSQQRTEAAEEWSLIFWHERQHQECSWS